MYLEVLETLDLPQAGRDRARHVVAAVVVLEDEINVAVEAARAVSHLLGDRGDRAPNGTRRAVGDAVVLHVELRHLAVRHHSLEKRAEAHVADLVRDDVDVAERGLDGHERRNLFGGIVAEEIVPATCSVQRLEGEGRWFWSCGIVT